MYLFIYKLFYILLHSVYTVLEYIIQIYELIWLKVNASPHHEFYKNKIKTIEKLPKHVTILLNGEEPRYKDLANLVLWCISFQIQFISFYDYTGVLNLNETKLEEVINVRKQETDNIVWYRKNISHKNGYIGRKIYLKILRDFDGKQSVVNVCKSMATLGDNSVKNIDVQHINTLISKEFEFPDPDLGLYCGNVLKLYNYPPWQIRVTEFLPIGTHHNVKFNKFIDCLTIYGRCEQRLGK